MLHQKIFTDVLYFSSTCIFYFILYHINKFILYLYNQLCTVYLHRISILNSNVILAHTHIYSVHQGKASSDNVGLINKRECLGEVSQRMSRLHWHRMKRLPFLCKTKSLDLNKDHSTLRSQSLECTPQS